MTAVDGRGDDNPQPTGQDEPGRTVATVGLRRYAGPVAGSIGVLVAIAVIVTVAVLGENESRGLEPAAPVPTPVESTSFSAPGPYRELFQMESDTIAALRRVVPGVALESDETTWFELPAQGLGLSLFVRVDERLGALRVHASRSRHEPCDGFSPAACRREVGPHGEVITIAHFDRQVPPGKPRDTEIQATVYRPNGAWVQVSVDNAAAPSSSQGPTPRTGQPPPLTEEQVRALASNPALDFCAARSDGPCAPE